MADRIDPAHAETEEILKNLENRIKKEYQIATKEMEAKIDDYMSRFEKKDAKWQEWVDKRIVSEDEYRQWRQQQMMVGKSYEALKDTLADEMVNADKVAKAMTLNTMPDVYATNFNYGTFEAEKGAKIDTSFTLYDRNAVNRLLKDDPDFIPKIGEQAKKDIAEGKVKAWNKQQVQSVMTQGILQGDSIPQLSKRLATTVGERNYKSAIRNARTMTTGVQNAGRMDSYRRAESLGIDMEVEWRATLDNRTRHEHRQLDGQRRPVGEPFEVYGIEIEYAGDPNAPAKMIYNCRCTLRGIVDGLEPRARQFRDDSAIEGMTYDEWKASKKSKSNPITLQEEKGEAIARSYRKEYATRTNSVKKEYDQNATPRSGVYKVEKDRKFKNREEENMNLIYNTYGGNITALGDSNNMKKNPDYEWNGKLWEEQELVKYTTNAIDQNVREGIGQIKENPKGVVLDVGECEMPMDEIEKIISHRVHRSAFFDIDVMVIRKGKIEDIFRYKK